MLARRSFKKGSCVLGQHLSLNGHCVRERCHKHGLGYVGNVFFPLEFITEVLFCFSRDLGKGVEWFIFLVGMNPSSSVFYSSSLSFEPGNLELWLCRPLSWCGHVSMPTAGTRICFCLRTEGRLTEVLCS